MDPVDVARLVAKYWPKDQWVTAVAVAGGETDWNERDHTINAGSGDDSYGLFQINLHDPDVWPELQRVYHLTSRDQLLDPETNIRVAYGHYWQPRGWSPWGAYTDGGYKKYGRYEKAQAAVASIGGTQVSWKPAACITQMLNEANALAPRRDKSSDGIIGDAAHAASASDHNPDSRGIVHAIDLTHDPKGGWDCGPRSEQIRLRKDARVLYVIFNGRWYHGNRGMQWGHQPWAWESYHGSSPHSEHMHVSVESGDRFESDVSPWWSSGTEGDDELTPDEHNRLMAVDQAVRLGQGTGDPTKRKDHGPLWDRLAEIEAKIDKLLAKQSP